MIIYHGATETVKEPLAKAGRANNQICLISQRLIDSCLKYKETRQC